MKTSKTVILHKKKLKLENQLANVKREIEPEEAILLEDMQEAGVGSVKIKSGGSIRIQRTIRGSAGGNVPRLVMACKESDMEDLVKEGVNANTLSAYVREFDPDNSLSPRQITKLLPKGVRNAIKVTETIQLVVTGVTM